ncbi:hypothetical protein XENOCAPTIV_025845 [Xenoophorus captivus]|uniref:Uncharacterized protein n=1 Tax=Xenoophorus captivus TaxID=1517983 RepID=A0ABV0RAD4_9TELE
MIHEISYNWETTLVYLVSKYRYKMLSGKGARSKSSADETANKKKASGEELEDITNAAILLALREQEERLAGKVKLAVREAVEEMLAGEIQALKAMVEASNSAITWLCGSPPWLGRKLKFNELTTYSPPRTSQAGHIHSSSGYFGTKTEKSLNGAGALLSAPTHRIFSEAQTSTSRLLFFPDYSNDTAQGRKAFDAVRKQLANRGLRLFLRYPATLKVRNNSSLHLLNSVADAEKFMVMVDESPRLTSSEADTPRTSLPTTSGEE